MSPPLRIVFAGTPDFAVPCLQACLASDAEVVAVYTQPDRPAGRGRKLTASPVKQAALAAGVAVEQPETLKGEDARAALAVYAADLMIVVAYGLILPRKVLEMPRHGCWNVHASVLPRWRGAAPIQRALLAGDAETGVDLMCMEAGLDTGPVLLERRTPIDDEDTGGRLHDRLAVLGAEVLAEGLQRLLAGTLPTAAPQPAEGATYAHKLDKAEARLDFSESAEALARRVRAFDPWPATEAMLAGERVRIFKAHAVAATRTDVAPGTLLAASREGLDLACAEGVLRVLQLQRPGGRRISAGDYVNARPDLKQAH